MFLYSNKILRISGTQIYKATSFYLHKALVKSYLFNHTIKIYNSNDDYLSKKESKSTSIYLPTKVY